MITPIKVMITPTKAIITPIKVMIKPVIPTIILSNLLTNKVLLLAAPQP